MTLFWRYSHLLCTALLLLTGSQPAAHAAAGGEPDPSLVVPASAPSGVPDPWGLLGHAKYRATEHEDKRVILQLMHAIRASNYTPLQQGSERHLPALREMLTDMLAKHGNSPLLHQLFQGCIIYLDHPTTKASSEGVKLLNDLRITYALLGNNLDDLATCARIAVNRSPGTLAHAVAAATFLGAELTNLFRIEKMQEDAAQLAVTIPLSVALLDMVTRDGHPEAQLLLEQAAHERRHNPPQLRKALLFHGLNDQNNPDPSLVCDEEVLRAVAEQYGLDPVSVTPITQTTPLSSLIVTKLKNIIEETHGDCKDRASLLLDLITCSTDTWHPDAGRDAVGWDDAFATLRAKITPTKASAGPTNPQENELAEILSKIDSIIRRDPISYAHFANLIPTLAELTNYDPTQALDIVCDTSAPPCNRFIAGRFAAQCLLRKHHTLPHALRNKVTAPQFAHGLTAIAHRCQQAIPGNPGQAWIYSLATIRTTSSIQLAGNVEALTKLYRTGPTLLGGYDASHLNEKSFLTELAKLRGLPSSAGAAAPVPAPKPLEKKKVKAPKEDTAARKQAAAKEEEEIKQLARALGERDEEPKQGPKGASSAKGGKATGANKKKTLQPAEPHLTKKERKELEAALAAQRQTQEEAQRKKEEARSAKQAAAAARATRKALEAAERAAELAQQQEAEAEDENEAQQQQETAPIEEQNNNSSASPVEENIADLEANLPAPAATESGNAESSSSDNALGSPWRDLASGVPSPTVSQHSSATSPKSSNQEQGTVTEYVSVHPPEQQLFWAASSGYREKVENLLAEHGQTLNLAWADPETGDTALLRACAAGATDVAYLLLFNGANLQQSNKEGDTPITMAQKLRPNNHALHGLLNSYQQLAQPQRSGQTHPLLFAQQGIMPETFTPQWLRPAAMPHVLYGMPSPAPFLQSMPPAAAMHWPMPQPAAGNPGYGINPMMMQAQQGYASIQAPTAMQHGYGTGSPYGMQTPQQLVPGPPSYGMPGILPRPSDTANGYSALH